MATEGEQSLSEYRNVLATYWAEAQQTREERNATKTGKEPHTVAYWRDRALNDHHGEGNGNFNRAIAKLVSAYQAEDYKRAKRSLKNDFGFRFPERTVMRYRP